MRQAIEIVAIVLVVLAAAIIALRLRKLRRDEMKELSKPLDRRLVSPPPSPYAPSKGFRLLDDSGEPIARPPVERPRLDPGRHYVFGDSTLSSDDSHNSIARHNNDWFLSRSSHRSASSILLRRLAIGVAVIVVAIVLAIYYGYHPKGATGTTTTTTPVSTGTTTTSLPSSFRAVSSSGGDATYVIPLARYRVAVSGSLGRSWTVYTMGPSNTLEWQGAVEQGQVKSLVMTGDSRVTLDSPSSATVSVDGRPVVFPTPVPSTLTLLFHARTSSTTST